MDDIVAAIGNNDLSWEEAFVMLGQVPTDNINDFIGYIKYERWKVE